MEKRLPHGSRFSAHIFKYAIIYQKFTGGWRVTIDVTEDIAICVTDPFLYNNNHDF